MKIRVEDFLMPVLH